MRLKTFTVDATSVQGIDGATATFKCLTRGEWRAYLASSDYSDEALIEKHLVGWSGIVDDDNIPLPLPSEQPDILDSLYMHEIKALARLLAQGPENLKN